MATKSTGTEETDRIIAASAYVLFFVPLLVRRESALAMFHAKQGLVLLIASVLGQIVASILTIVLIGLLLSPLVYLATAVLWIIGVANALSGKQTPLPLIGRYAEQFKF